MPHATTEVDYEVELRNLSILNHLKHPNIIELLSAYTYRGEHNLVFPLARGGDLTTFFKGERPVEFQSDGMFTIALSKLASAIEHVHDFSAHSLDLKLIGCHHDLKPRNILVDGSTFILADFGLSRFRPTSQSSNSLHKQGQGDYLAPECEDVAGDFEKHHIRRSSDIWSFGCIIAEVLTYMVRGATGVVEFRTKRAYKVGHFRFYHFHHGPGQQSPSVHEWLSNLEAVANRPMRQLLRLIMAMLSLDPEQRPTAAEVAARRRLIAVDELAQPISKLYNNVSDWSRSLSIESFVEGAIFESWRWTCGIGNDEDGSSASTHAFNLEFDSTLDILSQIREELENILVTSEVAWGRVFSPLRQLNSRLKALLPSDLRDKFETHLEYNMTKTQNISILKDTQTAFEERSSDSKIGVLAAIKRMTVIAMESSTLRESNLMIEPTPLELVGTLGDIDVALMKAGQGRERQILVEWMHYDRWTDEDLGHKRLARIAAIAELLNSADKPENFRVLSCLGFFHDSSEDRFGLIFDFPPAVATTTREAVRDVFMLREIFDHPEPECELQLPILGDRFKLAHLLAVSVAEFHKVGWLHKSISSSRVVFFPQGDAFPVSCIGQPYVIGFHHSRPGDPFAFTLGPANDFDERDYQHPEYLKNRQRYIPEFDIYSLGIVLLEIGLWQSLENMTDGWKGSPEEFREGLLTRRVPGLKQTMGACYFNVVDVCLRGSFGGSPQTRDTAKDEMALYLNFKALVVDQLARCSV
jgi:serine/threonine protein kinase